MAWDLDICGDEAISMPEMEECDECDVFEERLSEVEDLLRDFTRTMITMVDGDGTTTVAEVAAFVHVTTADDTVENNTPVVPPGDETGDDTGENNTPVVPPGDETGDGTDENTGEG